MKKIVSAVFTVSFILTGCGVDGIFTDGLPFWCFCFGVMVVCGYILFGTKGD